MNLVDKKCSYAKEGDLPLSDVEKAKLMNQLDSNWSLTNGSTRLMRTFTFKNFKLSYELLSKIANLAESERHHPELHLGWGHLDVEIWTHTLNNLVESDYILAAKIDQLIANNS